MDESLHQGSKIRFYLLLTGGTDASECPAVEGVGEGDDFVTSGGSTEFPGQLVESLVGFGPAVAEEDLTTQTDKFDDQFGKFSLGPREVEIGGVHQRCRLLGDSLCELWMGVPQRANRDARSEIEVLLALLVPEPSPLSPRQCKVKPPVGRHDIVPVEIGCGRSRHLGSQN